MAKQTNLIKCSLALWGETESDLAEMLGCSRATVVKKISNPGLFTISEVSAMQDHFGWGAYNVLTLLRLYDRPSESAMEGWVTKCL